MTRPYPGERNKYFLDIFVYENINIKSVESIFGFVNYYTLFMFMFREYRMGTINLNYD